MCGNVWVLEYHWYMGIDGSGMNILGVYTTEELAKEASNVYLNTHELRDDDYDSQWLNITCFLLNENSFNEY